MRDNKTSKCSMTIVKSLTADRKLLKVNPPLTSVTSDHHGVQCVKGTKGKEISRLLFGKG
uniref:SFRICE_018198 n=1 Tax=Spodoptera frugiperda TaxID=7108 RepID=A0A2H1WM11_SPOFR